MKKTILVFAATFFASTSAMAMSDKMDMKAMDKNGDSMISKSEFMSYHEAMFDGMKKDSKGMVSMKDMQMMMSGGDMSKGGDMMKGDGMKKDGAMMKEGAAKDGMKSK